MKYTDLQTISELSRQLHATMKTLEDVRINTVDVRINGVVQRGDIVSGAMPGIIAVLQARRAGFLEQLKLLGITL